MVFVLFAALSTLLAKAASLANSVSEKDWPADLSVWLVAHKKELAFWVFVSTAIGAVVEVVRAYLDERHQFKKVVEHLVDDCAKQCFQSRGKKNRITLFKVTVGWRHFLWGLVRLPLLGKPKKWAALFGIRPTNSYLGVYYRPADVRNRKSATAFRVSDLADECEGMAGFVYEEGFCLVSDLPAISRHQVHTLSDLNSLGSSHPVKKYADATRIHDLRLLKSFENFARHFIGVRISRSNGTTWGVLLVDSEEQSCPFPSPSGGGKVKEQLDQTARMIGKLV